MLKGSWENHEKRGGKAKSEKTKLKSVFMDLCVENDSHSIEVTKHFLLFCLFFHWFLKQFLKENLKNSHHNPSYAAQKESVLYAVLIITLHTFENTIGIQRLKLL